MTTSNNDWGDVSSIAQSIQTNAYHVVRELGLMQGLVLEFNDASGMNTRKSYKFNQGSAKDIGDDDDLTSDAFTPSADQTLTPSEIGLQFFITDARAESDVPESIIDDATRELGLAALDKVETDLVGEMSSLTGGTIGASGTAITWSYLGAAIAQARNANKNASAPLQAVIHGYQWAVLAKSASIAGASIAAVSPGWQEEITRTGGSRVRVAEFMGVPIYQTFAAADSSSDFVGGVFPKPAIAIDWRRPIRVRPQRDESRRGIELNMSAVYAHGVWRPALGVKMTFAATAPTS